MQVVADCDALTVVLVHLGLREPLTALLRRCGRPVRTLHAVYRREAQAALREQLDAMQESGVCELVPDLDEAALDTRRRKLHARVHALAAKRFRTTSQNDRDLCFLADDAAAVLASLDGPLGRLARERGVAVIDEIDVIVALASASLLDGGALAAMHERVARRRQISVDAVEAMVAARHAAPVLVCTVTDNGSGTG